MAEAAAVKKVLILGDSFIARLHGWAGENGKLNLNLNPARVAIYWKGLGVLWYAKMPRKPCGNSKILLHQYVQWYWFFQLEAMI